MRRKLKNILKKFLFLSGIFIILIIWVLPILWMVISSFKPASIILTNQLTLSFKFSLEHYQTIFGKQNFLRYIINSGVIALISSFISCLIGIFAAYSLARFKTGGKQLALWILSTRMAPPAILIIPFYIMFKTLNLIDTWLVLIIAYLIFNLSFVVWLMRGFFEELPIELEEAALIDGCSRFQAFLKVVLPLARPGIIASFIFCLIYSWNEFLFALVLTISQKAKTLPVAANDFITGYDINWGPLFASGVIIILPIILFAMIVQKRMIGGLTLGAIK